MKPSKYIYIVPYDDSNTIIFSGFTRKFLVIDNNTLESLVLIIKNSEIYKDTHSILLHSLKAHGFLIDNDVDEIDLLLADRERFVKSKEYKSTIVSTYRCNYNCWYCIQKHHDEEVDPEKIELIIKHIKTYMIENDIQSYILSWFGGEPLMEPGVIDYVSKELYDFCMEQGIQFHGAITTNGALLTEDIIRMLYRNHIDSYQITIDGDKTDHDRTKNSPGEDSSFETILKNIVNLLQINDRTYLTLRFNYTGKSLKSETLVDDVDAIIPEKLRSRINVDFHRVWQIKETSISIPDLSAMLRRFHKSGYKICSDNIFSICYVDKLHHNIIFFNGDVDKCDNMMDNGLRGYLDSDGHIVWRERPVLYDFNPLETGNCCHDCKYYPLCYGCCPVRREERFIKNGKMTCNYEGAFDIFEHRILDFCTRQLIDADISI